MFSLTGFIKGILLQGATDRTVQLQIQPGGSTGTSTVISGTQTANRLLALPDITDTLTTANLTQTFTNKSIDGNTNTLTNIPSSALTGTVNLTQIQSIGSDTIVGNNTGGSASPTALSTAQVAAILPTVTTTANGLAPASGGGTSNFLRADLTWASPVAAVGTPTPTALTNAQWDSNVNMSANSMIEGFTSTATAAGTTTLTVTSAQQQIFTGSTTQNVILPITTSIALGQSYTITNLSTGALLIASSSGVGGGSIVSMPQNTIATFTAVSTTSGGSHPSNWAFDLNNLNNQTAPVITPTYPGATYWSGYYPISSTNYWESTNTSTYGDYTFVGSIPTVTTLQNSGFTVANASGNLPGISFSAPRTGTLKITVFFNYGPVGTNTIDQWSTRLIESSAGPTNIAFASGLRSNQNTAYNSEQVMLVGYLPTVTSTNYNLKIQSFTSQSGISTINQAGAQAGVGLSFVMEYIS